jgi:predicted Rossmann-fold nucleotide-binding protein
MQNMDPIKFKKQSHPEIKDQHRLTQIIQETQSLKDCTVQGIDLNRLSVDWSTVEINNTTFLGCLMSIELEVFMRQKGAFIYIHPQNLPYDPYRRHLYSWQELMKGFSETNDNSLDLRIYEHFNSQKFNPPINEALCQRIHDHSVDEALRDLLHYNKNGMTQLKCVGIMGGHSTLRTDPYYERTVLTAKLLTENDYTIVSGGGPGIMEAANLGAYLAGQSAGTVRECLQLLKQAPHYTNEGYHEQALKVLELHPDGATSLAIPTWFYGHEPSNLFATYIAKYFSNSIREDTLLAICLYGIVFAPGSAGTTQEIFQDATQNHYGTFNYYSPMIFLGKERYEVETLIFPLLKQLSYNKQYHDMLLLTDKPDEVLRFLKTHPPVAAY